MILFLRLREISESLPRNSRAPGKVEGRGGTKRFLHPGVRTEDTGPPLSNSYMLEGILPEKSGS